MTDLMKHIVRAQDLIVYALSPSANDLQQHYLTEALIAMQNAYALANDTASEGGER